jgi:glycerol-3-phosphate dehydrogenase
MKNKIIKAIEKNNELACYDIGVHISSDNIVTLTGEVDKWQHVVDIGHTVAKVKGVKNIVNDIKAKGITIPEKDNTEKIKKTLVLDNHMECDVVIIGAGISGCAIARELSKYNLKTIVLEKNSDIAEEATKANNGNIHPGILAKPGTLKAKLNLRGNKLYTKLSEELNFELKRPGSMNIVYDKKEWNKMLALKFLRKTKIGYLIKPLRQVMKVPGLKWINTEELLKLEPNVKGKPIGALWMTTMGLVEPYEVCIALAENAVQNGVTFMLETEVLDVITEEGEVKEVITNKNVIHSKYVINCCGVYADNIANMAGDRFFTIHPRRGAIAIFDKSRKGFLKRPVGTRGNTNNKSNSKGGGVCVTPEGNLLWGPTAKEIPYKEDKSVEVNDIDYIMKLGNRITEEVKKSEVITFFAGIRAADYMEDFIIGMSKKVKGFINVAGIQSPGLASAPAIAEMVGNIIKNDMKNIGINKSYNPIRKQKVQFRNLSHEEQDKLIKQNNKYGNIICRCEVITEGEIIDAIHSEIPATTIDAVKRRTRAGMGRCQGGFCGPRVLEIIARELGKDPTQVTLKGSDSYVLDKNSR